MLKLRQESKFMGQEENKQFGTRFSPMSAGKRTNICTGFRRACLCVCVCSYLIYFNGSTVQNLPENWIWSFSFTFLLVKYPKDSRVWLGAGHSPALPLGAPLLTHHWYQLLSWGAASSRVPPAADLSHDGEIQGASWSWTGWLIFVRGRQAEAGLWQQAAHAPLCTGSA